MSWKSCFHVLVFTSATCEQRDSCWGKLAADMWQESYHNGLMLHVRHDNHSVILLSEAVCHSHHIFSSSAKAKTHNATKQILTQFQQREIIKSIIDYVVVWDSPSDGKTLKLSCDACGMAGWDEVLQGKHLSPPITHLGLTQVHRAKRTWFRDTQPRNTSPMAPNTAFLSDNCLKKKIKPKVKQFNHAALTFSYFIYDAKDFSQLRNSFVERLNVKFHISCWKHTHVDTVTHTFGCGKKTTTSLSFKTLCLDFW